MNTRTQTGSTPTDLPRSQWLRCWSAVEPERVQSLAQAFAERYAVEELSLAQSGLGLLPLRDSALGEAYYLGEVPLARAHVRLCAPDTAHTEGAALLLDDRASLARAMAILDGVTAAAWSGHEEARALLTEGAQRLAQTAQERRALLAATRVDFSLLGATDEEDDDA